MQIGFLMVKDYFEHLIVIKRIYSIVRQVLSEIICIFAIKI